MNQKLLMILQKNAKWQSVNSLESIYPEDFMQLIETENKDEARGFIEELNNEFLLQYKYRFMCDCGEMCTAFQHKMDHEKYICPVCGREYENDEIVDKSELLLDLDKDALIGLRAEHVEFKPARKSKESKIVTLQVINSEKEHEKQMEIFMGSSSEAKDFMENIAAKLEELQTTPLMWSDTGKGIFPPGENTIDALMMIAKRVDAAIFIFNADDKTWNEESMIETCDAVRDNVLLEYGIFTGAKGKRRVCFVCKGKDGNQPKEVSDLKGITYIDGNKGDMHIKNKLKDWLENIRANG